jgi:replicative DNA helicase
MKNNLSPQDLETETALLGAILLMPFAFSEIKSIGLDKSDFYKESHSLVFEACQNLSEQNKPISILTVRSELERTKMLDAAGGVFGVVSLTLDVASSANALHDAGRIKELGLKRRLHDFTATMYQRTADPSEDVFQLLDAFKKISEQNILDASLKGMTAKEASLKSLLDGNKARLERQKNGIAEVTGVPTFSRELDLVTQGKHRGKLDVYGAFTGNGKSLQMVADAYKAAKAGYNSVIISLEMGELELSDRLMSIESGITYSRITKQLYSDNEFNILLMHHEKVQDILERITIYTVSNLDTRKVENIIFKHKEAHTFYIDYIQLVSLERGKQKNEGLGQYTKELKQLAIKYDVNITILAQLNRLVLDCKTKDDLHEQFIGDSKQIADDADNIVLAMIYDKFGITQDCFGNPTKQDYDHLVGFHLCKQRVGGNYAWDMWVELGTCNYKPNEIEITNLENELKEVLRGREPQETLSSYIAIPNQTEYDADLPF